MDIRALLLTGFADDGIEVGKKVTPLDAERIRESAMRTLGKLSLEGFIIPEPEVDVDENGVDRIHANMGDICRERMDKE